MAIFNWKPKLVLPTVYDDALSYQEILGKVIDALNQMGETGKLANAVFPNGDPVISIRDNGINVVGKAKIVYMDGNEKDCDIDVMIPLAKGDNVNFAVVNGVVKIFATDTTYTGGNGIVFEGTVVKANYDEVQRKLTAGEGIVIQGATIAIDPSAIGNALVAGNGITVTGNTISVDYSKVQAKLTAGNGITVTGNTISVDDSKVQAKLTAGNGITISEQTIAVDTNRVEVIENKTNTLSADSTAVQYPSAKAVYDKVTAVEGVANTANSRATTAQATANDANEVATSARSTANSAKTAAEQAGTKADTATTKATSALETADAAQAAATLAQNRADSAYNLANTADTASTQNASRIQIIEDTAPQFSLEGTTLTITLPA